MRDAPLLQEIDHNFFKSPFESGQMINYDGDHLSYTTEEADSDDPQIVEIRSGYWKSTNRQTLLTWTIDLHLAVELGVEDLTTQLLDRGANIESRNAWKQTPLHVAAEKDHEQLIPLLLEYKADIEAKDIDFQTPLHLAAYWGNEAVVALLLKRNATVDCVDKGGSTPLHLATKRGFKEVVTVLLRFGADVNKADNKGWTALHFAANLGYDELAILLCDKKADVNETTNHGRTALYLASAQGDVKMVYLLLELKADAEKADLNGCTALKIASENAHLDVISILVEYNAYAEAHDTDMLSPLKEAMENGNTDVVSTLLQTHAKNITEMGSRNNALHITAEFNYLDAMKTVLALGADMNAVNLHGHTPLHVAATLGHSKMVTYLLDNGATMGGTAAETIPELAKTATKAGHAHIVKIILEYQPDLQPDDEYRNVILHTAVALGNLDTVTYLLEDGKVDLENMDENGMTPLFSAADHPEMIALLVDRKANVNARCPKRDNISVLHYYVQLGKVKAMNVLLNCGCNIEPTDIMGHTPLHYAVLNSSAAAVKLLVQRGVNMELRNNNGKTAFHTAVECDNLQIVELLIDFDININAITDHIKATPLQRAIQLNNLRMIQLLLAHNARINIKGDSGDTALHTAVRTGKDEFVSLLLRQNLNIDAKNSFGDTPLDLAVCDSNFGIQKLLKAAGANSGSRSNPTNPSQQNVRTARGNTSRSNQVSLSTYDDHSWLKWVPEEGTQALENVGNSHMQRLNAIGDDYQNDLPVNREINFQEVQDSDDEDLSAIPTMSNENSRPQTPIFSDEKSPSSSMTDSEKFDSEMTNSIYDTVEDTLTSYFNPILNIWTAKWASKVIEYLINWSEATLYHNGTLFIIQLKNKPDGPSPVWVSQFNKMSIMREPGLMVLPVPGQNVHLSVPDWHRNNDLLIRFINAIYVCRITSQKVSSQAFSEVLGCLEEDISTPLRATLIAGLAITSMSGGYNNVDLLVKAMLSVYSEAARRTPHSLSTDLQVLHRKKCNCGSKYEHRPLSPVAAAKAVGIHIWLPRNEARILPRVWDLYSDTLVKNIDVRQVYFITHRWNEKGEIEYKDIAKKLSQRDDGSTTGEFISSFSDKLKRIKSVIIKHARYVWLDTICIDRSSMSEVDKTIRSMYRWYANCRAVVLDSDTSLEVWKSRGWCLQEGAAAGLLYGILKKDATEELVSIQELARIQNAELCQLDLSLYYRPGNAAEILARMDARKTTNVEDMSYALIGIFSINIPLGYGEEWDARTKVLNELATKKGDISFLSFATNTGNAGKYLPLPNDRNFLVAECLPAKISARISHFGLTVEAQLIGIPEFQVMLSILKRWKRLRMNRTKSVGLSQLIKATQEREIRNSKSIKVAIVHSIRSLMLVEIHGDDRQSDGSQAYKPCHRLQCCQFEHYEFERLFADINVKYETIWLGDKLLIGTVTQSVHKQRERQTKTLHQLLRRGARPKKEKSR